MSGNQTNHRRCAACKYLRRRCTEDCALSPYFPPNDPKRFENVHKIFGASNVARMLQSPEIPPELRFEAADSIAKEALNRLEDPVYGSTKPIFYLQQQICAMQLELAQMQAKIAMYKAQVQTQFQIDHQNQNQNFNFEAAGTCDGQENYHDSDSDISNNDNHIGGGHFSDYFKNFPDFC